MQHVSLIIILTFNTLLVISNILYIKNNIKNVFIFKYFYLCDISVFIFSNVGAIRRVTKWHLLRAQTNRHHTSLRTSIFFNVVKTTFFVNL